MIEVSSKRLIEFFGADMDGKAIDAKSTNDFWIYMKKERSPKLAEETAKKTYNIARQIWKVHVNEGTLDSNPWMNRSVTAAGNKEKHYEVTLQEIEAVMEVAPNIEWRLLIALSRFAGIRVPSEIPQMKWEDINFDTGTFIVKDAKNDRERVVPLFPEIEAEMIKRLEECEDGQAYVFSSSMRFHTNPGVIMQRIIRKAGLVPWPRVFNNMRATRESELVKVHKIPEYIAAQIVGNSKATFRNHYAQISHDDIALVRQSCSKIVLNRSTNEKEPNRMIENIITTSPLKSGLKSELLRIVKKCPEGVNEPYRT